MFLVTIDSAVAGILLFGRRAVTSLKKSKIFRAQSGRLPVGLAEASCIGPYCPDTVAELHHGARSKLESAQRRYSIIATCWSQADLF